MKWRRLTFLLALSLFVITTCSAFAKSPLVDSVNVVTPGAKYVKLGTATLIDPNKDGYMVLSLSSSPSISHTMLGILSDTYGEASDIPWLSYWLPGSEYIDVAKGFLSFVDSGMICYMKLTNPVTGETIWDGLDHKDDPFKDGRVFRLGCDHASYDVWFRGDKGIGFCFIKLAIVDNISWKDAN